MRRSISDAELSAAMKKYLIGKEFLGRIKQSEESYISAAESANEEYMNTHKLNCKGTVAEALAKECHLAPSTIISYSKFAVHIDLLREKNNELASQILSGKVQMSFKDIEQLTKVL